MPKRTDNALASLRRLWLEFPDVEEGPCYGTPGFRVRGKLLARLHEDGHTLAVKCGHEESDAWQRAKPKVFFTTEHYRGYPTVLVNLHKVELADLRSVLEQAWRRCASKRSIAAFDAQRIGSRRAAQRDQVINPGARPTKS